MEQQTQQNHYSSAAGSDLCTSVPIDIASTSKGKPRVKKVATTLDALKPLEVQQTSPLVQEESSMRRLRLKPTSSGKYSFTQKKMTERTMDASEPLSSERHNFSFKNSAVKVE